MPSPSTLAYWEGLILIVGLFGVVFWKLCSGDIDLDQLFEGDSGKEDDPASSVSAGRVQMFLVTISVAFYYLMQVIQNPTEFPTLPPRLVAVLAGSHAIYLGGKAQAMLSGRFRDLFDRRAQ
ncbi:MAG TPA: hypothetical protein VI685_07725 [Candidatus Angelobacter sp.]